MAGLLEGGVLGRFKRAATSGINREQKGKKKISLVKYIVCNSTALKDAIT